MSVQKRKPIHAVKIFLIAKMCGVKDTVCLERDWKGNCVKTQQNYVCKNTMYAQQTQSCQTQTQMHKNPREHCVMFLLVIRLRLRHIQN